MKNIKTLENFDKTNINYTYSIDWSLFEGEIEYDIITEELKVVFSDHGNEQADNFKIDKIEIEELIQKAAPSIINSFNKYSDNMDTSGNKQVICTLRDRTKKIPHEIIVVFDYNPKTRQKEDISVKKENIAVTGEIFNASKINTIRDNYHKKGMYRDPVQEEGKLRNHPYKDITLFMDNEDKKMQRGEEHISLQNKDYVFRVITTRRKKDFRPNTPNQIFFDVYKDNVDRKKDSDF
jgi:hypothetical protein